MKKTTSKKLMNYGAMSAAILATAAASGQVVFTDINDVTIDAVVGGNVDIDLNQDGLSDYNIQLGIIADAVSFTINPDPVNVTNGAFVGITNVGFHYPALLAADDIIDATSPTTDTTGIIRGDLNFYGCAFYNSQFCGEITDGYIGLVFDFAGNTHYGWLLLDSNIPQGPGTTQGTATIRAYAFEATPDTAITVGEVLSLEDNIIEGFSSFVSNNVLTLNARTPLETVTIHSISGQEVISRTLSNTTETVDLNGLSTGVYIATVSIEGRLQAIKFVK